MRYLFGCIPGANSNFISKVEREGKRAATRQYIQYGEETHSEADKVIQMKWNWNKCYECLIPSAQARRLYFRLSVVFGIVTLFLYASSYWFIYTLNYTHSLPGTFYVIHKNAVLKKGDLIAYRWQGGATYPAGSLFIKKIVGMQGDVVKRVDQSFLINEHYIGTAKKQSKAGVTLLPATEGMIPSNEYFVATSHPDSLDSRYRFLRNNGNVRQQEVIGRAYEIF